MDGRMLLPMTSAWRLLGAQAVDVPQRKCMVDIYIERERWPIDNFLNL